MTEEREALADELERLLPRVSAAPWRGYSEPDVNLPYSLFQGTVGQEGFGPLEPLSASDVDLIAALRNNLPAILTALRTPTDSIDRGAVLEEAARVAAGYFITEEQYPAGEGDLWYAGYDAAVADNSQAIRALSPTPPRKVDRDAMPVGWLCKSPEDGLSEFEHADIADPWREPLMLGDRDAGWTAAPLFSAPPRQVDRDDVSVASLGLEWCEDGYALRTPFDGDVNDDTGQHIVVGGETVVTFADSDEGDKVREWFVAALSSPTPDTRQEGVYQSAADCPLGVAHGMASTHGNHLGQNCCDWCGFPADTRQEEDGRGDASQDAANRALKGSAQSTPTDERGTDGGLVTAAELIGAQDLARDCEGFDPIVYWETRARQLSSELARRDAEIANLTIAFAEHEQTVHRQASTIARLREAGDALANILGARDAEKPHATFQAIAAWRALNPPTDTTGEGR